MYRVYNSLTYMHVGTMLCVLDFVTSALTKSVMTATDLILHLALSFLCSFVPVN